MNKAAKDKVIVVGVDGSKPSLAALRWAVGQAELTGEAVRAVTAWQYPVVAGSIGWGPVMVADDMDMQAIGEKTLAEAVSEVCGEGSDVRVEQQVVEGYAPDVLVSASASADLLVVGSRGHGTFAEALLGSVSQNCAHHAKCPVVIVRGHH